MTIQIISVDNKFVVEIPETLVVQAGFKDGEPLEWVVEDKHRISLRRPDNLISDPARKRLTIDEIVQGIPDEVATGEYDWGRPLGVEFW